MLLLPEKVMYAPHLELIGHFVSEVPIPIAESGSRHTGC
jgi:hypothetical protein